MINKKRIAYSFLIGDLLHFGHIKMLESAKEKADYHICGVISDNVVKKWINPLICSCKERKAVIEKISYVDEVIIQNSMDPTQNLKIIHKNYPEAKILLTQSHLLWSDMLGSNYIKQINGEIIKHKFYPNLSRENIAKRFFNSFIQERKISKYAFNTIKIKDTHLFQKLFSTKADTLKRLKPKLKRAVIEREFVFNIAQWRSESQNIISQIADLYNNKKIVIRSSSLNEDSLQSSNAGHYESILDIQANDQISVERAINKVIESYRKSEGYSDSDQVLVQEQTQDVAISGVVFTRNLGTNTPYYLINYDETGNQTDLVTGGLANKKMEIARNFSLKEVKKEWREFILVIKEVELFFSGVALDIEFAIKTNGQIVIFQVRPLAANSKFWSIDDDLIKKSIEDCRRKYLDLKDRDNISNDNFILSDMAFWNPAELIGDRPNYLDYSLLNYLIMKSNWNDALLPLGYTKVTGGLMVNIGNKPYINMHYTFLSLLPEDIPVYLKKKLLEFYNEKLKKNPQLHDKIEFEITYNCYTFDIDERIKELSDKFTPKEIDLIKKSILKLTNNVLVHSQDFLDKDDADIKELGQKYGLMRKQLKLVKNWREKLHFIDRLIEDCQKLGTIQFSRTARMAFFGNALLRSLKDLDILTSSDFDLFMSSISTVATDLDMDFTRLRCNQIKTEDFLEKYGHLRPGTFDITKLPYSKNPSYITSGSNMCGNTGKKRDIGRNDQVSKKLDTQIINRINEACNFHKINSDGEKLLNFIKRSIESRELYKFSFTKNISLALELLTEVGQDLGFNRNDLSHLDISSILNKRNEDVSNKEELINSWKNLIAGRKEEKRINSLISLPPIVFSDKDFVTVSSFTSIPNFITDRIVEGNIVFPDQEEKNQSLTDRIVILEKADPGYDWIFTKNIKALITKYGGVGSHMAIRCAEFGIPAAIGCGSYYYDLVKNSKKIELDCAAKQIKKIL